jgi:hypothetical protein
MSLFIQLLLLISSIVMRPDLQNIQDAAEGLLFMSESDHSLQVVRLDPPSASLEETLLQFSDKEPGSPIEKQELDYFFRNATRIDPMATRLQQQTAHQFQHLVKVLREELSDIQVYRVGEVDVDAFIIGKLRDGVYAGLRTKLIET